MGYERFTDRARMVIQLAAKEAVALKMEYVGTEHILLGLLSEGSGVAANILRNLDLNLNQIRTEVKKCVANGPDFLTTVKLPLTPRAIQVHEKAIEEARHLEHNYVGTEHLLLGLLRVEAGVAYQVLTNLGINVESVRQEITNLVGLLVKRDTIQKSDNEKVLEEIKMHCDSAKAIGVVAALNHIKDLIKSIDAPVV